MELVFWIVMGGIAGWIVSLIFRSSASQGLLGDIVLGILGAVTGGLLMNFLGEPNVTGLNTYSILVAVLGAIIVIVVGRALARAT